MTSHSPADLSEGARTGRRNSVCPGTSPAGIRRESYHVRLNFSGPLGRRSSISLRFQAAKQARSGLSKCFRLLMSVVAHAAITNTWGIPYDGKYKAKRVKTTA